MSERLEYYLHDAPEAFRFELSGSLSGPGAQSVYHAWRTALSILGKRPLSVDITAVSDVDERGRSLLLLWRRHGVRIIAEPLTRPGFFARLRAALRRRAAGVAEISARAEQRTRESAPASKENAGITGFSETRGLEQGVPSQMANVSWEFES